MTFELNYEETNSVSAASEHSVKNVTTNSSSSSRKLKSMSESISLPDMLNENKLKEAEEMIKNHLEKIETNTFKEGGGGQQRSQ
jgi:hypothetical protein